VKKGKGTGAPAPAPLAPLMILSLYFRPPTADEIHDIQQDIFTDPIRFNKSSNEWAYRNQVLQLRPYTKLLRSGNRLKTAVFDLLHILKKLTMKDFLFRTKTLDAASFVQNIKNKFQISAISNV